MSSPIPRHLMTQSSLYLRFTFALPIGCVSDLLLWPDSCWDTIKRRMVYFGSTFGGDTVHHGRKSLQQEQEATGWSHCICSQETAWAGSGPRLYNLKAWPCGDTSSSVAIPPNLSITFPSNATLWGANLKTHVPMGRGACHIKTTYGIFLPSSP